MTWGSERAVHSADQFRHPAFSSSPTADSATTSSSLRTNDNHVPKHFVFMGDAPGWHACHFGQAVKIATHVDGPVKVIWTREEDIQHDMYRPYFFDRISAGLDLDGMPVVWHY